MRLILPAQVEGVRTRKDNTLGITFGTQEVTPEMAGQLVGLNNRLVVLMIKITEPTGEEIKMIDSIKAEPIGKSLSQRMREALYRAWEQNNAGFRDFDLYYGFKMESAIKLILSELKQ